MKEVVPLPREAAPLSGAPLNDARNPGWAPAYAAERRCGAERAGGNAFSIAETRAWKREDALAEVRGGGAGP